MAEIAELAVDRPCRRQGIGQLLLATAESWARGHGFGFMRLETQSNNVAACSTYARSGFVLADTIVCCTRTTRTTAKWRCSGTSDLRDGQTARIRTVDPESVRPVR